MKARTLIAAAVAAAALAAGCQHQPLSAGTSASTQLVYVYANEDLSGPSTATPVDQLTINASGGYVCYASSRHHVDTNQLYVDCDAAVAAGAQIAP